MATETNHLSRHPLTTLAGRVATTSWPDPEPAREAVDAMLRAAPPEPRPAPNPEPRPAPDTPALGDEMTRLRDALAGYRERERERKRPRSASTSTPRRSRSYVPAYTYSGADEHQQEDDTDFEF